MRDPGVTPPRVVYIGGMGRSGSTLLELLLAQAADVVALGEVVHLWERGLQTDELCSCGETFGGCPMWRAIGEQAFDGWGTVDARHVLALKAQVDRTRRTPILARNTLPDSMAAAVAGYTSYYRRIYAAAEAITGRPVVVDSSKHASLALALAHDRDIDLRVVHLVRDPRGVAHSWARRVVRPETADQRLMVRHSPARSSEQWLTQNSLFHLLPRRGVPMLRVRYEDLIADDTAALGQIRRFAGLPEAVPEPQPDSGSDSTGGGVHSVAGNPLRFRSGPIVLRADDAWKAAMPVADRCLVTALTAPLALRYGYLCGERRGP